MKDRKRVILEYRTPEPVRGPSAYGPQLTSNARIGRFALGFFAGCVISAIVWFGCLKYPLPAIGFSRETLPGGVIVMVLGKIFIAVMASTYDGWKSFGIGVAASVPAGALILWSALRLF